jgi:hypothetical protein
MVDRDMRATIKAAGLAMSATGDPHHLEPGSPRAGVQATRLHAIWSAPAGARLPITRQAHSMLQTGRYTAVGPELLGLTDPLDDELFDYDVVLCQQNVARRLTTTACIVCAATQTRGRVGGVPLPGGMWFGDFIIANNGDRQVMRAVCTYLYYEQTDPEPADAAHVRGRCRLKEWHAIID